MYSAYSMSTEEEGGASLNPARGSDGEGTHWRVSARVACAVSVPQYSARDHHWALSCQRYRFRVRGGHPDCRHCHRHPGEAATARVVALGILLPVPVLDLLLGRPAVFRQ